MCNGITTSKVFVGTVSKSLKLMCVSLWKIRSGVKFVSVKTRIKSD